MVMCKFVKYYRVSCSLVGNLGVLRDGWVSISVFFLDNSKA